MDDADLSRALRPGAPADELLRQALLLGRLADYADTGDLAVEGQADFIARTYRRRAHHLAGRELLLVDLDAFDEDLRLLGETSTDVRVVVRIEPGQGESTVYTALGSGSPWQVGACLIHRLPD